MRTHDRPLLAHLDPDRAASIVALDVLRRARRDAKRLGLVLQGYASPSGPNEEALQERALRGSNAYRNARLCAQWATTGQGKPEEIAVALRELRADLAGVAPADAHRLAVDLKTTAGVLVVAVAARLALREGRTVDVDDVATLASVDARTIRAAAQAGTLRPLAPVRPMRFAADVVRSYLYHRGVPGFSAPTAPPATATAAAPPPAVAVPGSRGVDPISPSASAMPRAQALVSPSSSMHGAPPHGTARLGVPVEAALVTRR
jgi:hypothetical protein